MSRRVGEYLSRVKSSEGGVELSDIDILTLRYFVLTDVGFLRSSGVHCLLTRTRIWHCRLVLSEFKTAVERWRIESTV